MKSFEDELDNPELLRLFAAAGALHQNFYENWLPSEVVVKYGEAVKQLVEKLETSMEEPASVSDEDKNGIGGTQRGDNP